MTTQQTTFRSALGAHALVVGGSVAGLMAARVLSDYAERVTILERDRYPAPGETRKGVPQARQAHGLLTSGLRAMQDLFPGLAAELVAAGALPGDVVRDFRWHHFGGYKARFESGFEGLAVSRILLEETIRRRVAALPNVEIREACAVQELVASPDRSGVAGVRLRSGDVLHADLVVDATGRGSRGPAWLEALGFERPEEETVRIGVGYTSRLYRRQPEELPGMLGAGVFAAPPVGRRVGTVIAQEGDRWIAMLGGWHGDHAPPYEADFLAFARSLPAPDVYELVRDAVPVSDFAVHTFPSNLRRRYERLGTWPEGYLATGDAVCSFNPVYGQGISVAALEALALRDCLAERARAGHLDGLPEAFFRRIAPVIDCAWALVGGGGATSSNARRRPAASAAVHGYLRKVHDAARHDEVVCRAFFEVANLLAPPSALFRPRVALRVLGAHVLGGDPRRHFTFTLDDLPLDGLAADAPLWEAQLVERND